MNRKLIGIIIILSGAVLCFGIIYVVFLDGFSFYNFFNSKENDTIKEESSGDLTKDKKDKIIFIKEEPKKFIAVKENPVIKTENNKKDDNFQVQPRSAAASKDDLLRMAGSFSERFGSYSNQSNFSNITDLKIFMSRRMKKWANSFIADQRENKASNDIYYGIITKAITREILDIDDYIGEATIKVKTRRREATGTTNNVSKAFDQTIIINFIKEAGAWKVDSANWQQ